MRAVTTTAGVAPTTSLEQGKTLLSPRRLFRENETFERDSLLAYHRPARPVPLADWRLLRDVRPQSRACVPISLVVGGVAVRKYNDGSMAAWIGETPLRLS